MTLVEINKEADIVNARSAVKVRAAEIGFGLVDQTRISTAVSELARNIFTYAGKGEVHIEENSTSHRGIKVTFIDDGPGIADVELALKDGFSTTNSMGKGLPGAKRLTDLMDIDSRPGEGTRITIEKWLTEQR